VLAILLPKPPSDRWTMRTRSGEMTDDKIVGATQSNKGPPI
jgi:hypothetical protein